MIVKAYIRNNILSQRSERPQIFRNITSIIPGPGGTTLRLIGNSDSIVFTCDVVAINNNKPENVKRVIIRTR